MSECVIRMEMPKNCYLCPMANFFVDKTPYCRLTMRFEGVVQMGCKRPDWCPIICSLPEGHGRLVDADSMEKEVCGGCVHGEHKYANCIDCALANAPTIVPAERSEK